jgi:hypothetical protein
MSTCLAQPPFDLLPSAENVAPAGGDVGAHVADVASRLLEYTMDEYRSIRKLEDALGENRSAPFDRQLAGSLRRLYDQWVRRADELLTRVRDLQLRDRLTVRFEELDHAVGRTMVMLNVTLEDLDRADEEIRAGQTVSLEEVRRELRARSHG